MKQTNTHAAGSISCYTERPQVSIDDMQTLPLKGMLASFMLLCRGKLKYGTCTKFASRTNELDFRPLWRKHNKPSQPSQHRHFLQTRNTRFWDKDLSLTSAEADGKSTFPDPLIDAQCKRPLILYHGTTCGHLCTRCHICDDNGADTRTSHGSTAVDDWHGCADFAYNI